MHRNSPRPTAADHFEVASVMASIGDAGVMASFLEEILTPSERASVAMRWKLLKSLAAGMAQRSIASRLGVSLCKITRGSRILRDTSSVSRRILSGRMGSGNGHGE